MPEKTPIFAYLNRINGKIFRNVQQEGKIKKTAQKSPG
jgi:hypothetical protein